MDSSSVKVDHKERLLPFGGRLFAYPSGIPRKMSGLALRSSLETRKLHRALRKVWKAAMGERVSGSVVTRRWLGERVVRHLCRSADSTALGGPSGDTPNSLHSEAEQCGIMMVVNCSSLRLFLDHLVYLDENTLDWAA